MRCGKQMVWIKMCVVAVIGGLLASVAQASPRGGERYDVHRVEAYGTDVFTVTFYGGEEAVVAIDGDGDTDLDLYVYDEFGNQIACDTDDSDTCVVRFTPKWTGPFKVKVRNRGWMHNIYKIFAA